MQLHDSLVRAYNHAASDLAAAFPGAQRSFFRRGHSRLTSIGECNSTNATTLPPSLEPNPGWSICLGYLCSAFDWHWELIFKFQNQMQLFLDCDQTKCDHGEVLKDLLSSTDFTVSFDQTTLHHVLEQGALSFDEVRDAPLRRDQICLFL